MSDTKLFGKIAWSNLFAQMSEQVALATAPLVAVLLLRATASDTAWLQMMQTLPFLMISPFIGILADRYSARNLMISAEITRAVVLSLIFVLLFSQQFTLPLLALLGFMGAVGTVMYSVATPTYVPAVIPKTELLSANRWIELVRSLSYTAGPALGGVLVGYVGAPSAYISAIILSIVAFSLLLCLPKEDKIKPQSRSIFKDLYEGAQFIIQHPLLRPVLLTALFFNTSWFIIQGVFVAYATTHIGLAPTQIGFAIAVYGGGMIIGAIGLRYLSHLPYGALVLIGPCSGLLGAIAFLATVWFPSIGWVWLGYFLFGAGPTIWTVSTVSLRQAVTPSHLMGRVSALLLTTSFGARPIGSAIAAIVAIRFGVEYCLWLAWLGFILQLLVLLISKIPSLKVLPTQLVGD